VAFLTDIYVMKTFFWIFTYLALVHVPVIPIVRGDHIGAFDLVCIAAAVVLFKLGISRVINGIPGDFLKFSVVAFALFALFQVFHYFVTYSNQDVWGDLFSIGIAVKQLQLLLIFIFCLYVIFTRWGVAAGFHWMLSFYVLTMFSVGIWKLFVVGDWHRLGLPMKEGVSSNPAGLVLCACIVLMTYRHLGIKSHSRSEKLIFALMLLIAFVSLFLTDSKTNGVLLLVLYPFVILGRAVFNRAKLVGYLVLFVVAILCVQYIASFSGNRFSQIRPFWEYVINPSSVGNMSTIQARQDAWGLNLAKADLSTFRGTFWGEGSRAVTSTDNTYLRLLVNNGILAVLLFVAIYLPIVFWGNQAARVLAVFILLNGILMDTALVSFRTMQVFFPLLAYGLALPRILDTENQIREQRRWHLRNRVPVSALAPCRRIA